MAMRGAPPVQLDCARDARWRGLESALAALAAGTAVAWVAAHQSAAPMLTPLPMALAALVAIAAAAVWWLVADALPRRQLNWDGNAWLLDGAEGRLALKLDAGRWVLLRFAATAGPGRARWLALDLARSSTPRHLCRAALQAHALRPQPVRLDG